MTGILMMLMEKMYDFCGHCLEPLNLIIAFIVGSIVLFTLLITLNNILLALGIYYLILIGVFIFGYISIKTCEKEEEKP